MTWVSQLLQALSRPLVWWVVVATWEQGVRVRFGKSPRLLPAGLHFRIPFLDRVAVVCVRQRVVVTACRTVTTKDGHALTLAFALRYAVRDALTLVESVAQPEGTMEALAQSIAAGLVAGNDRAQISPELLEEKTSAELETTVKPWGIDGARVRVVTFAYAKVLRLLQAQDQEYPTRLDYGLDEKPAAVS